MKDNSTYSCTNPANPRCDRAESNKLSTLPLTAKAFHDNRLRLNYTPFSNVPLNLTGRVLVITGLMRSVTSPGPDTKAAEAGSVASVVSQLEVVVGRSRGK